MGRLASKGILQTDQSVCTTIICSHTNLRASTFTVTFMELEGSYVVDIFCQPIRMTQSNQLVPNIRVESLRSQRHLVTQEDLELKSLMLGLLWYPRVVQY